MYETIGYQEGLKVITQCLKPLLNKMLFLSYEEDTCIKQISSGSTNHNNGKILKISPGAYIFQRPFLRGLFLEGLMYGGKFAFQN